MIERNLTQEHIQLMSTMTNEQRRIYNTIMKRVNAQGYLVIRSFLKNYILRINNFELLDMK